MGMVIGHAVLELGKVAGDIISPCCRSWRLLESVTERDDRVAR